MKTLTIILCLLALIAPMQAQVSSSNIEASLQYMQIRGGAAADTACSSATDTTNSFRIGTYPLVSARITAADRISITKFYIDFKARGAAAFAVVDSVTTAWANTSDGVACAFDVPLRYESGNKLLYLDGQYRFRVVYAGSGNDAGTRVYWRIVYGR